MFQARNICNGGPKFLANGSNWKTKFRERCRKRIKEDRNHLFNSTRNLPTKEEFQSFVMETIHDEWKDLKESSLVNNGSSKFCQYLDMHEELILKELEEELLLQEESECHEYLSQFSEEGAEYGQYLEELQEDHVMCPLCCHQNLVITCTSDGGSLLTCSGDCPLSKKIFYGIDEVRRRLESALEAHSKCPSSPGFTFITEDPGLYLVCSECGTIFLVL